MLAKKVPSAGTFLPAPRLPYHGAPRAGPAEVVLAQGFSVQGAQRQGWELNSVSNEQKGDREKNRVIRVRQRAIGRELRRIYDNVVKEPVPDDFLNLLQKIDDHEDQHEDEPEEQ